MIIDKFQEITQKVKTMNESGNTGIRLTSIKIPQEYYEKLKTLKYSLYLRHCIEVSFVEIMEIILKETSWEALEQKLIAMNQDKSE